MLTGAKRGSIEQAHDIVVKYCSDAEFDSAHLYLIRNNIEPAVAPGTWEYLARRSALGGSEAVAHATRRRLWEAQVWTGDTALREAGYYLGKDDVSSALFILETVFGSDPDDADARVLLARAHLKAAQEAGDYRALIANRGTVRRLAQSMSSDDAEQARLSIDLYRFSDQSELALEVTLQAREKFADNIQFAIREARLRDKLNQPDRARDLWQHVADTDERYRTTALFQLMRAGRLLDRPDEVERAAAALTLEPLKMSDRLRLAVTMGQQQVLRALVELVITDRAGSRQITSAEGARIAGVLLDNGDIGMLMWLRRLRIPLGRRATSILDACGFGAGGTRDVPATFQDAADLRSPDFMLPLDRFLEQTARPSGWPGVNQNPDRILMVNAALGMGGAERQFVTLVKSLIERGVARDRIDVAIFSLAPDRGHDVFLPDLDALGVSIHDLREREVRNVALPDIVKVLVDALPTPLRGDVTSLWHLANELRPTVLHGWQDRSALASGIVGQALSIEHVLLSARNMSPETRQDAGLAAHKALFRDFTTKKNIRVTANSAASAVDYERWLGVGRGTIGVLSNALDTERFALKRRSRAKAGADRPIVIAGIFRLVANKRPLLWVRTLAALREEHGLAFTPKIFGRGPLADDVRRLAEELGLADLTIQNDVNDPAKLYSDIDAMLLMSSVEGTPNVVLEAQACGIPVAACDVGGVSEALHQDEGSGSGLLLGADVAPADAAGLLHDWLPGALSARTASRRRYVEDRYSTARIADRTWDFYCGTSGST